MRKPLIQTRPMILIRGGAVYGDSHTYKALPETGEEHVVLNHLSAVRECVACWEPPFRGDACKPLLFYAAGPLTIWESR
jgi:hypothetical protein